MITIPKQHIRDFAAMTAKIKTIDTTLALTYVLYESKNNVQTLTKTNLINSCRYVISRDEKADMSMLIDESILLALSKGDGDIIVKDGVIIDGKTDMKFQPIPVEDYPYKDVVTSEFVTAVSGDMCKSIGVASEFVNKITQTNFSYVHINNNVFAYNDRGVNYFKAFPNSGISLVMRPDAADIVSTLDGCNHFTIDNVDYFETEDAIYGFTKPDVASPDYMRVINSFKTSPAMEIDKRELITFCELAKVANDRQQDKATLTSTPMCITLNYNSGATNKSVTREAMVADGYPVELYSFNITYMLTMLKSIPYREVSLCIYNNMCVFTSKEDADFLGVVAGMV